MTQSFAERVSSLRVLATRPWRSDPGFVSWVGTGGAWAGARHQFEKRLVRQKGGGGELSDCVVLFWVNFISEGSGGQGRTQAASS